MALVGKDFNGNCLAANRLSHCLKMSKKSFQMSKLLKNKSNMPRFIKKHPRNHLRHIYEFIFETAKLENYRPLPGLQTATGTNTLLLEAVSPLKAIFDIMTQNRENRKKQVQK